MDLDLGEYARFAEKFAVFMDKLQQPPSSPSSSPSSPRTSRTLRKLDYTIRVLSEEITEVENVLRRMKEDLQEAKDEKFYDIQKSAGILSEVLYFFLLS